MSSKVILYDLPSKQGTSWSLNPWKTRMVLNYKGVDYKTEWVEYPDLAAKLKSLGIPPNESTAPGFFTQYTSPAIRYDDGTYGMDSWPIAHELEKRYPSPPLHLDDPIVVKVRDHVINLMKPLAGHVLPKVPTVVLNPVSAEYFNETRHKRFGMTLQELERTQATEEAWKSIEAPAKEMGDWLRENGGPFFLGETVSYADFIIVSIFHMLKKLGQDVYDRFLALDPAFPKLFEASKQWLEKED